MTVCGMNFTLQAGRLRVDRAVCISKQLRDVNETIDYDCVCPIGSVAADATSYVIAMCTSRPAQEESTPERATESLSARLTGY